MRYTLLLFISIFPLSQAEAFRYRAPEIPTTPAMPLSAPLPQLPDECTEQPTVSGGELRFVTVYGAIDWEGRPTQIEVQEPSDSCLKNAAVEAVREWRFEPVDPDTEEFWRHSFETTLIYSPDDAPRFEMSANDTLTRYPPRYPEQCMARANAVEIIGTVFDVTAEGVVVNIKNQSATNPCLISAAEMSVNKWRYAPRIIAGRAYPRQNVYADTSFYLGGNSLRHEISGALITLAFALDRKRDPRIALDKIALIEKMYWDDLRESERVALLRYRGAAKIDALDYVGALEDLRAALAKEPNPSAADGIENIISQLEAALGSPSAPK